MKKGSTKQKSKNFARTNHDLVKNFLPLANDLRRCSVQDFYDAYCH